jgi:phytoene dehydrogenase-like protein
MSTRREFIRTIMMSSGAVYLAPPLRHARVRPPRARTDAPDFRNAHRYFLEHAAVPKSGGAPRHVETVVVGGGPAGLAAAWRLQREGREVLLFEHEPLPGGTLRGAEWDGNRHPFGSTYFVRNAGDQRAFFDDIGFHPIETGEDALVVGNDAIYDWWSPANVRHLPFPASDAEAFVRFREVVLALDPPPHYPLDEARPADLDRYDAMSASEYLSTFGSQRLTRTMDLYCRSVLGAPATEVNAYAFLNFYGFEFGDNFSIPCWTAPGGLAQIAERATTRLGASTVERGLVVSVENEETGVRIRMVRPDGETNDVVCRAAIVAAPKRIARRIVANLPAARNAAMEKVRYAPYVTLTICARERLFKSRAFDFWFDDPRNRFTDVIDVTFPLDAAANNPGRTSGSFVYMLSSARPEAERATLTSEAHLAEIAQDLARALDEHVPGTIEKIEELRIFSWGHSLVIPAIGSHRAISPLVRAPFGRVCFAGADNDLAPGIENAIDTGIRAAEQVLRSL